jgi:recombination associated protein RdgC
MFKNMMLYRIGPNFTATAPQIEENLDKHRFAPCGATQELSMGWTEPRGLAHAPLIEAIGGHWMLKLQIETKVLPASVVKRKVDEIAAHIEASEGRKPGKKERRDIQDNAKLELLPMAFTKQGAVLVWIDPTARLLVLSAGSQGKADAVMTLLMEAVPGLTVELLQTTVSPAVAMADWLVTHEAPANFSIDRECELKSTDENKATVRYAKHPLDIDEVRGHIEAGKVPTKLAMSWSGRVSLLLTDLFQIKKISFLEGVFENTSGEKEDKFDADMAIATGELSQLIPDLLDALGGELGGEKVLGQAPKLAQTASVKTSAVDNSTDEGLPF